MADEEKPNSGEAQEAHETQETVGPPDLKIVRARKDGKDPKRCGRRMTSALYEALWEAYKQGTRAHRTLAQRFDISHITVGRAINKGWPDYGWVALKDRMLALEQAKIDREAQEARQVTEAQRNEWQKAKVDSLKISQGVRIAVARMLKGLVEAAEHAKFTRTKRIRQPDGTFAWSDVPMNAYEISECLRRIASSVREIGAHDVAWLFDEPARFAEVSDRYKGFLQLTDEQMDHILKSGGQLPPGVTLEQLLGPIDPQLMKHG
jgi:hypothetical protein